MEMRYPKSRTLAMCDTIRNRVFGEPLTERARPRPSAIAARRMERLYASKRRVEVRPIWIAPADIDGSDVAVFAADAAIAYAVRRATEDDCIIGDDTAGRAVPEFRAMTVVAVSLHENGAALVFAETPLSFDPSELGDQVTLVRSLISALRAAGGRELFMATEVADLFEAALLSAAAVCRATRLLSECAYG